VDRELEPKYKMEKKSAHEEIMAEILEGMNYKISIQPLNIKDANLIISQGYKLLEKCAELRLSRDNWSFKYKKLKNETG